MNKQLAKAMMPEIDKLSRELDETSPKTLEEFQDWIKKSQQLDKLLDAAELLAGINQ